MLFEDLRDRGLIYQITDESLQKKLQESTVFYCGFDPTSDSLHLGSLLPLLTARRFQLAGHQPILVLGGATGMIGDPSGKSQERNLLSSEQIKINLAGIQKVMEKFLDFQGPQKAIIANNLDWIGSLNVIDYLRDIGKHFSVNMMLGKDSVKTRVESRDQGISYTEFSYMILQSFDFYHLHQKYHCQLQIGGSDQWGNIVAGTDLIRRMAAQQQKPAPDVFGMTFPLVTKSDGTKFGKTESGNVWLDAHKTSPYAFYQFFLQLPDAEVMNLMKLFSFKSLESIRQIESEFKLAPEKRLAQRELAKELTELVHGKSELERVERATEALFQGKISQLDFPTLSDVFQEAPSVEMGRGEFMASSVLDLLVKAKVSGSKGAARKDIEGGGISLNDAKVTDVNLQASSLTLLHERLLVIRKGKKNYFCVKIV